MRSLLKSTAIFALLALPASADEVSDTLKSALSAYEDGDVAYALEELEYAKQLMLEMKTEALNQFLPAAPEGWTRTVNNEMGAALGMLGGGVGAEAEYNNDSGDSFTITIMADNPMVGAMAGMIGSAGALGAKIRKVGRQKFMDQDGELSGLVANRILVQASGASLDVMLPALETIDYRKLGRFGQ
jgi:hypothetical protein